MFVPLKAQILHSYFNTKRRLNWSREHLNKWHQAKLTQMIHNVKKDCPFYSKLYENLFSFSFFPIISKKEMLKYFSLFNKAHISYEKATFLKENKKIFKNPYSIGLDLFSNVKDSSTIFLNSLKETTLFYGNLLAKTTSTLFLKKEKIAFLLDYPCLFRKQTSKTSFPFAYFDCNEKIDLDRLASFKPDVIIASLAKLTQIRSLNLKVKRVAPLAEILNRSIKKELKNFFHQNPHQIYQVAEGFLGFTCSQGTLHLNEDLFYIEKEYIDSEKNHFFPVLTHLYRETQPMIRYRLDEILVEKKTRCSCGSSFIAVDKIEGRSSNILYFPSYQKENYKPIYPSQIDAKLNFLSFNDYFINQTSPKDLTIHLNIFSFKQRVKQALNALFDENNCAPPTLHFQKDTIPKKFWTSRQKIQRSC